MENTKVTDMSFLNHFTSGDKQMANQLINVFFTTSKDAIDKIEGFIASKDWERVAAIAHSFKPQLSYMGIKSAELLIIQLEDSAKSSSAENSVPVLFESLKSIVEMATEELKEEIIK
jgi:HPt (histidine-containing phosphotransfer) domain-containing protein